VNVKANGTVAVEKDFSVPGHPDCFVVGDAAHVVGPDGRALPGLASVAQHQGRYVGKLIAARLAGSALPNPPEAFVPSKLATITRHVGIAEYGDRSITGFPAWLMGGLLHLRTLSTAIQSYRYWQTGCAPVTHRRSARLIIRATFDRSLTRIVEMISSLSGCFCSRSSAHLRARSFAQQQTSGDIPIDPRAGCSNSCREHCWELERHATQTKDRALHRG
jgi:hypothetical protein